MLKSIYTFVFKCSLLGIIFLAGCEDQTAELALPVAPSSVVVEVQVADDRSGDVVFTPSANNALSFQIIPGDGNDAIQVLPGESLNYTYTGIGQFSVTATIVAYGTGGVSSSITSPIDLDIEVKIDPQVLIALTGGTNNSSKRWIWRSQVGGVNGHFGVGDPNTDFPGFFAADANGIADCAYDDVLIFSVENGSPKYQLETNGEIFMNWADIATVFPGATPGQFADECRAADDILRLEVPFSVRENVGANATLTLDKLAPMSYFINAAEWEILELSPDILRVRGIQEPPAGGQLAWYFTFVPEDGGNSGTTERVGFENLIFADEFDADGAPNPDVWNFDIGDGCDQPSGCGWGNQEAQYYTDRSENAVIENGVLKITTRKETFGTRDYTSARLTTKDKFDFTFGRVDVRARVPVEAGTWTAAWMLGSDIDTNPWPGAGEIDIMEHVGNQANRVLGTVHTPSGFGGTANGSGINIPSATSEFHVYSIDWTEEFINFYVDDVLYFTYSPTARNNDTYPFEKDFYLLLNMAIGGTLGGNIADDFNTAVYEIDYIRVYQ